MLSEASILCLRECGDAFYCLRKRRRSRNETNIKAFKAFSILYLRFQFDFKNRKIKVAVKIHRFLKGINAKLEKKM